MNEEGLQLLDSTITRPNGIAISPNEDYLYVANSDPERKVLYRYTVKNGVAMERQLFFDASDLSGPGLPDGLKISHDHIIYATGPGGVLVIDQTGRHLGTINTGQATANVGFNADESELFITADMYLLRVILK